MSLIAGEEWCFNSLTNTGKTLIIASQQAQTAFSKLSYAILCLEKVPWPTSIPFHEISNAVKKLQGKGVKRKTVRQLLQVLWEVIPHSGNAKVPWPVSPTLLLVQQRMVLQLDKQLKLLQLLFMMFRPTPGGLCDPRRDCWDVYFVEILIIALLLLLPRLSYFILFSFLYVILREKGTRQLN
jgi:hypothetical protein